MRKASPVVALLAAWVAACHAQPSPAPLAGAPRLVVQTGHSQAIDRVLFSPDGRQALTENSSGIVLWDVATGRQIREQGSEGTNLVSAAFALPGRQPGILTLAGSPYQTALSLKALASGADLPVPHLDPPQSANDTLQLLFLQEQPLALSPDGALLYSRGSSGERCIREALGKQVLAHWKEGEQALSVRLRQSVHALLSATADRRLALVSASMGARQPESAQLFDLAAGKLLRRLGDVTRNVTALALAPNGQYALTVTAPSVPTAENPGDAYVQVWDTRTGQELRRLTGHDTPPKNRRLSEYLYIWSVAFSADSKLAITAGTDGTVRIWNVATGKEVRQMKTTWPILSAVFSPDGSLILAGGIDGIARLWDSNTGRLVRELRGGAVESSFATVSPNGRYFVNGSDLTYTFEDELTVRDAPALIWDLESGHVDQWRIPQVLAAAFSADGRRLAVGTKSGSALVRDMVTGEIVEPLQGVAGQVDDVQLSPDGTLLAASSVKFGARIQDNKSEFRIYDLKARKELRRESTSFQNLAFSTDGRLARGMQIMTLRDYSVTYPANLGSVPLPIQYRRAVQFAPDNHHLLIAGNAVTYSSAAYLWDIEKGMQVRRFDMPQFTTAALSLDGRIGATGNAAGAVTLWDVDSGRSLRSLDTVTAKPVTSLAFLSAGRRVAAAYNDGSVAIFDAAGPLVCTLFSFNNGDWAVVTPDGRFDTNDLRGNLPVHWIVPDDPLRPLPLELFMREYYEPKLLSRVLSGEVFPPIKNIRALNLLQPMVRIVRVAPEPGTDRVSVDVEVEQSFPGPGQAGPASSGASTLQLFRDGKLAGTAMEAAEAMMSGSERKRTVHFGGIRLPHGTGADRLFTAYAFNRDRVKSITAALSYHAVAMPGSSRGRAYLIHIGVNEAGVARLSLKFAANDARLMASELAPRLQATGAFDRVVTVSLVSDAANPNGAPKASIKAVLEKLAGKPVDPRQFPATAELEPVTPDDLVLVTFSGHGYADRSGQFYLVPSDAGRGRRGESLADLLAGAVTSTELSLWLRDVDAGELVLVIDACQSAASVESDGFKPGPMGSRGLGQLAWDKGARILAATQADDVAIESRQIQQGVLTYALTRDGLDAGRADRRPKDGRISLSEWLSYAVDRVPPLLDEIRRAPSQRIGEQDQDRVLVQLRAGSAPAKIQQPSLFDFSEANEGPVISTVRQR